MDKVPVWVSLTQIGASIFLGIAALVVSITSAIVAYRNNFGWKPIALVSRYSLGTWHTTETDIEGKARLHIEVWNRRKYPILIRYILIKAQGLAEGVNPPPVESPSGDEWHLGPEIGEIFLNKEYSIAPTSYQSHEVHIPIRLRATERRTASCHITVRCFDPRRQKHDMLQLKHLYVEPMYYDV